MMCFFKRKQVSLLIDLHEYEHQCIRWKRKGIPIRPPPIMAIRDRCFTRYEEIIMRDNLSEADEIYETYK